MNATNTNGMDGKDTDTIQGVQNTKALHERDKLKLKGVVIYLRNTEACIEQYLNKKEYRGNDEELQTTIKNLAIILKSGDEDQSEYLLQLMKKSDEKMMQLLSKLAFQLFKSKMFIQCHVYHQEFIESCGQGLYCIAII